MDETFSKTQSQCGGSGSRSTRNNLQDTSAMELSTIINAESSLPRKLCLRVDVAMLASTLANGGSQDPFLVPENMLDKFEDDEAKVHVLERHRDYLELKLRLKEQQQQRRDDLKSRLENKGSICAVGHD